MNRCIALLLLLSAAQTLHPSSAAWSAPDHGRSPDFGATTASAATTDLPLYEVPPAGESHTLALFITGDGGWAHLDRNVSAELARRGISVVGLSSLRYFYQPRTPDLTAHVVTQTLRHYLAAWHGNQIVLIGYSFGADVMPFIVNRLPQDLRERLISVNLLGLGTDASFEVPVGKWIHGAAGQPMPVAPELSRMGDVPVLCVYGEGESESLCPSLAQPTVAKVRVGSGHHFSNEYGTLAEKIADFAARARTLHGGR